MMDALGDRAGLVEDMEAADEEEGRRPLKV